MCIVGQALCQSVTPYPLPMGSLTCPELCNKAVLLNNF